MTTVLLLGGTGRTGGRVMAQLLGRGVRVRAIVRSARSVPANVIGNPGLSVVEANVLSATDADLLHQVRDCHAVISCLGHVTNVRGIFGPPHDLVTRTAARLCRAIDALKPPAPIKFILMSSVSVNRPDGGDARRGILECAILRLLGWLIPPAGDNQRAADFLFDRIGTTHPFVQWVAVRPDTLRPGDVSAYQLHDGIVSSLFRPGSTNMANVAHFMCELVDNPKAWEEWKGTLPVIINTTPSAPRTDH